MTKRTYLLLGFVAAKFFLQYLLLNGNYDLQRDEYLHLDQGSHLAWGYLSVPPVTSWVAVMIRLLGNNEFWVRFFPALFGSLTMVVVWKIIEELKGNLFALVLGSTAVLLSALLRLNILFQPNSLDVLSWTTVYFLLIKYLNTGRAKWLLACGLAFAFGFLNKYNIGFLLIGLAPALLVTEQRRLLGQKEIYLAAAICLVVIAPNLIWQYQHHFPVFFHLRQLAERQLVNVNRWDFFKDQVIYFIGAMPVILAALYGLWFYLPFKPYRLFFWSFVFTLAVFSFFRAKSYYAIGLYPVYIAFGSVFLSVRSGLRWQPYVRTAVVALPVVFGLLLFRTLFSIQSPEYILQNQDRFRRWGLLRWEDGKDHSLPQDFSDMLGWRELATKVDAVYDRWTDGKKILVLCDNYGQAGAINYYSKHKDIHAVSFNADYIDWFDLDRPVIHLIRVKDFDDSHDELKQTLPFFEEGFVADSVGNRLAREYRTTIFAFSEPRIDVNKRLVEEREKTIAKHQLD